MMKKSNEHVSQLYDIFNKILTDPTSVANSDKLTKYVIAKSLLNGVQGSDEFGNLVSDIERAPAYQYFYQPFIFTGEGEQLVRFIKKTDDLTYDDLTSEYGFYVWDEEEDLSFYIEREANFLFREYFNTNRHILIHGPPKVGKTRLVFEELRKQKGYYVFSFKQGIIDKYDGIRYSDWFKEKKDKLIWFIDNIDLFSTHDDRLSLIYDKLTHKNRKIIVIATIRAEKTFKTSIERNMLRIKTKEWEASEAQKLADFYGYDMKKFSGTPFSIKKDINELKDRYKHIRDEEKDLDTVYVMRYLKLLSEFDDLIEIVLLRDVFRSLREFSTNDDFENSCNYLKKLGLLRMESKYISSWDPVFNEIITEDDYPELNKDLNRLIPLFSQIEYHFELPTLMFYFSSNKLFERTIYTCNYIVENTNIRKDKKDFLFSMIYVFWGDALIGIGRSNNDLQKYEEACEKFELAIKHNKENSLPYYCLGRALEFIGMMNFDIIKYEEACEKFELAIKYEEDYVEAYFSWGASLYIIGRSDKDANKFKEACKKFELAIKYQKDYAEVYFLFGMVLTSLATIEKDVMKFKEACEKFELAIKYKENFTSAIAYLGLNLIDPPLNYIKNKQKGRCLLELAFFLLVKEIDWQEACGIAHEYLSTFDQNKLETLEQKPLLFPFIIVYYFALSLIFDEGSTSSDLIDEINLFVEKYLDVYFYEPIHIILEAIQDNKLSKRKYEIEELDITLETAIILANKIVSIKNKKKGKDKT